MARHTYQITCPLCGAHTIEVTLDSTPEERPSSSSPGWPGDHELSDAEGGDEGEMCPRAWAFVEGDHADYGILLDAAVATARWEYENRY